MFETFFPRRALLLTTAALALALSACAEKAEKGKPAAPASKAAAIASAAPTAAPPTAPAVDPARLAVFQPLPDAMQGPGVLITPAKVDLGRKLYFDKRLSKAGDLSCDSCHGLKTYGVDNKARSVGDKQQLGGRNSPTVYNAAGHIAQFWDGRAADVEAQALGPVTNPVEMAMKDGKAVEKVLKAIPGYVDLFKQAFPDDKDPVTFENAGKAIGAFERKLVTPGRFDKFLQGDAKALTTEEIAGFNAFFDAGCATCHSGAYVGGQMFQKLGVVKPWPAPADPNAKADEGRGAVTKNPLEIGFFKVPSLRNVAKTGPYFHDGGVADLGEAVKLMATHQVGRELTPEQVKSIVTFLEALTGDLPTDYIAEPALPEMAKK